MARRKDVEFVERAPDEVVPMMWRECYAEDWLTADEMPAPDASVDENFAAVMKGCGRFRRAMAEWVGDDPGRRKATAFVMGQGKSWYGPALRRVQPPSDR